MTHYADTNERPACNQNVRAQDLLSVYLSQVTCVECWKKIHELAQARVRKNEKAKP